MSEWTQRVEAMSNRELHSAVCAIAGYSAPFTTSWNHILALCEARDFLKHPRYLARTQTGAWVVREHQSKAVIVRNASGPLALCKFVAIIAGGTNHQPPGGTNDLPSQSVHARRSKRQGAPV